jgi:hypothetical protein
MGTNLWRDSLLPPIGMEESEHRRSKSAEAADNLSGKRTETSKRKDRFRIGLFFYALYLQRPFHLSEMVFYFFVRENGDGDSKSSIRRN